MSTQPRAKRITVPQLVARKSGEPIVVLTAYTAPMAGFLDSHVDILLVGNSLGMVVYGFDSTLPVTLDMMIAHGARGGARLVARLRHRRYAVRELSGIAGAGLPQRRAGAGRDRRRPG